MMTRSGDVVIVGGGVIGLSIAYALAREGLRPLVFDRRELGREASWAGAGLIPPVADRDTASSKVKANPLVALRSWSARLYPEWSAALLAETGIDPGYRRTGGVDVARTESEDEALRAAAGQWRAEGIAYERIPPGDYARVEPALNPELRSVYYLPDRAQVRNPRLLRALIEAASRRGASLESHRGVEGFITDRGRIAAVRTSAGEVPCGLVIVAAGAWSGGLLEPAGVRVPTPPLKGQIVLLKADRPLLRRVVEHGKNYLVPRDDGRILIGATEEDAGFDVRPTALAARDLLDEALRLCPVLGRAAVEATWAGLRPGSIDTRPYIGTAPGIENLIIASGHKRAGLQLAPATAELVADLVLGRPPRLDLAPFRPDRSPDLAAEDTFRS
jgi:glycine oxidase